MESKTPRLLTIMAALSVLTIPAAIAAVLYSAYGIPIGKDIPDWLGITMAGTVFALMVLFLKALDLNYERWQFHTSVIDNLRETIEARNTTIKDRETMVDDLHSQIRCLRATLEGQQGEIATLHHDLDAKTTRCRELTSKLEAAQPDQNGAMGSLDEVLTMTRASVEWLERRIESLRA